MIDSRLTETFLAICQLGSFEQAARRLSVSQPAVSQRLKALERELGNVLITRGRPALPTAAGRTLLSYLDRVSMLEEEAVRALLPQAGVRSTLRLGVNADSLDTWFPGVLAQTLDVSAYTIELLVDDQDYTHRLLERGEAMGCVTSLEKPIRGASLTPLGVMRYFCASSPAFAARYFADGVTRSALLQAPALTGGGRDRTHDHFVESYGVYASQHPKCAIPSPSALCEMTCLGMGYGWIPESQARAPLERGELVRLLPEVQTITLNWYAWDVLAPRLATFYQQFIRSAQAVLV